jgi:hypothetical protein
VKPKFQAPKTSSLEFNCDIFFGALKSRVARFFGCQIFGFQTKNPNLGKFWRALDWKILIYFMAIWNILRTFGKLYDNLVNFMTIW